MNRLVLVAMVVLGSAVSAAAQTEGKISVGGSVTFVKPTDSEVQSLVGGGPLVRLSVVPMMGWRTRG